MIAQLLLNQLAQVIDGKIAKIIINGSYEITNFKVKEVNQNVVALNYIVPVADVSLITTIAVVDANNKVLTNNNVNVPIVADHLMLQTISVKEEVE